MNDKRAVTDEEKREIVERLYKAWTNGGNRYLRLGQMIGNCTRDFDEVYNVEDYKLLEKIEFNHSFSCYKGILNDDWKCTCKAS